MDKVEPTPIAQTLQLTHGAALIICDEPKATAPQLLWPYPILGVSKVFSAWAFGRVKLMVWRNYNKAAGRRTFGKASVALLNEFRSEELMDMPLEEHLDIIVTNTNNRFADPRQFAEEIKRAARNSYRLNPKMQSSVDVALAMTIENIRFFEAQCKKLDKVIARELIAIPQTLNTVPGIGNTLAAGIIAEIGDVRRFHHE